MALSPRVAKAVRRRPGRSVLASLCIFTAGGLLRAADRILGLPTGSVLAERYRMHDHYEEDDHD